MKRQLLLLLICYFSVMPLWAQYKFDNKNFRNIYIEDLCNELKNHPDRLLLDVRSRGEYSDTSSYSGLNIGRLKGAVNIPVRELSTRLKELPANKNQPIFIYCSHSQRSRRSSKMLADSGFTNIINVNGGMTEFNVIKKSANPCLSDLYETANHFQLLSPKSLYQLVNSQKDLFIIDIRPDSVYRGISKIDKLNAQGKIKGSINIPFSKLSSSLGSIPRNKSIVIIDSYGDDSNKAAQLLISNGYSQVNILFNGLDRWISEGDFAEREKIWVNSNKFGLLATEEITNQLAKNPKTLLLDIRSKDEFTSHVEKNTYLNIGHLKNAVNIPLSELASRTNEIKDYQNKDIILYSFGSSQEVFTAAKLLAEKGFVRVKVLTGGLWDIRWKAANIKGLSHLEELAVEVPSDNL